MSSQVYDSSAMSIFSLAIAPGSDFTTEVESAEIDRSEKELMHLAIAIPLTHTITGAAADDAIEVSFAIKEASGPGGTFTTRETKIVEITGAQAETNATHSSVVVLPLNLLKNDRVLKIGVTVAAKAGSALTLSSATGCALVNAFPMNNQPDPAYSIAGYHVEG